MRTIYFNRPKLPKLSNLKVQLGDVYNSYTFSNFGPKNTKLESMIAEITEFDGRVVTFANATIALMVCLKELGCKKALVPSFTFAATIQALHWANVDYDYVDIDPETLNMDIVKLEEALLTGSYDLILPVHAFGNPCSVYEISVLAGIHNCKVLYDGASAFASFVSSDGKHKHVSSYGDITVMSLHATKVLPAGEGGIAFIKDKALAERIVAMTNFGFDDDRMPTSEYGINGKLCEFMAATALCGLKNVSINQKRRLEIVAKYQSLLKGLPLKFQKTPDGAVNSYQSLCLILDDELAEHRDIIIERMKHHGIQCRKYYHPAMHFVPCFKKSKFDLSVTEDICRRNISLPLHLYLEDADIDYVSSTLRKVIDEFLK